MIYAIILLLVVLLPTAAFYGFYAWADRWQSESKTGTAERSRRERDRRYARMLRGA